MPEADQGLLLQEEWPKEIQKEHKMKEFFLVSKKLERDNSERTETKNRLSKSKD